MDALSSVIKHQLVEFFRSFHFIPYTHGILEVYANLSPEQKLLLNGHVSVLRDYLKQANKGEPETVLLELACFIPGGMTH